MFGSPLSFGNLVGTIGVTIVGKCFRAPTVEASKSGEIWLPPLALKPFRRVQAAYEWFPRTFADQSARSYWWRGVERHFRPADLPADQQRDEQRCSEQATSDHSEKTQCWICGAPFPAPA